MGKRRRVRFGSGNRFGFLGFGGRDGFVWQLAAECFEALELLDGTAVETLRLGLVTEEEGEGVGLAAEAVEAEAEPIGTMLFGGDWDALGEIGRSEDAGLGGAYHGSVEAVGEEAGFESGHAQHGLLGEDDALDGEEFLGVDGLVGGDGVRAEVGDDFGVFEGDDGEAIGVEGVLAGILRGTGFAFGGAGAGGTVGIGAIGGKALRGERLFHRFSSSMRGRGGRGAGMEVIEGKGEVR